MKKLLAVLAAFGAFALMAPAMAQDKAAAPPAAETKAAEAAKPRTASVAIDAISRFMAFPF